MKIRVYSWSVNIVLCRNLIIYIYIYIYFMYEGKPLESDLPANNYFFVKLQSVTALVDFSFLRVRTRISCLLVIRSLYVLVNSVYRSTFFSLSLSLSLARSSSISSFLLHLDSVVSICEETSSTEDNVRGSKRVARALHRRRRRI